MIYIGRTRVMSNQKKIKKKSWFVIGAHIPVALLRTSVQHYIRCAACEGDVPQTRQCPKNDCETHPIAGLHRDATARIGPLMQRGGQLL